MIKKENSKSKIYNDSTIVEEYEAQEVKAEINKGNI